MVLSVHIRGNLNGVPDIINRVFGLGAYGVALYFLISGFFGYPSVKKSSDIKDYAFKRAIRILPTYYVSLLLTFILDVFIIKDLPLSPLWSYHVFFLNMFVPSSGLDVVEFSQFLLDNAELYCLVYSFPNYISIFE